ncbi:MAG TPA: RNB domain-containing ribonuclease, partial [Myxococcota bacterium]|nr:RNB domain-containing ribonuclease [Myxococcota bacterium]
MRRVGGNEGSRERQQIGQAPAAKAPAPGSAARAEATPALPNGKPLPSSASDVRQRNAAPKTGADGVAAGVQSIASTLKEVTPALMPMMTTPRRDLQGEITGHLRRVVGRKNQIEATFYPDDRRIKPLVLHPQDAQGIAEGGRIAIQASEGGLQLVTSDTEKVYSIVGRVERDGTGLAVVARDANAPLQRVPLKGGQDSLLGKMVLAHIEEPLSQGRTAELASVFGEKDAWRVKLSEIAVQRGVEATFSKKYSAELEQLKATFNPDKIDGYVDLTDKPFITIDNPYSMDLDQAMCIEDSKTTPGASDVYYAIADLSYFFKLSGGDAGAIDERARRLQTTTYMPGVDMPVLHRLLSEDLISLGPDVKRPSIIIKYTVGADGKVIGKPEFLDAVIKSQRKTNYGLAQDFIDGKAKVEDPVLVNAFNRLKKVGGALLDQAKARGMITAPEGERWANIDENGELVLERRGQRWIEEANAQISITANSLVGEFLVEHNAPAYHRVHKAPDEARIALAREAVRTLGVDWPDKVTPAEMLAKLDKSMPKYRAVRNLVLRSQPRAIVSADPTSHEGLKLAHYVQVTAPMRRERDARNHAFVRQVRDGQTPDTSRGAEVLEFAAIAQERDSRVEREIRDIISAKALEGFSGKVLKGEITFLSPRGFEVYFPDADIARFVELPGRNRLEANGTVLRSDGGNPITITLGETMDLRVGTVNAMAGRVEVVPLTEGKPVERKGKPQKTGAAQTIGQIRGDGFTSPLVGKRVTTEGVVSGVNAVGFYVESANPEEGGLLVRTRGARVAVGDQVRFTATVRETHDANNEFARSLVELVEATPPERIGEAQLSPPVDLEKLGPPPADAAGATDYWRKLLGRRIAVPKGKAVSPSNRFGDLVVLPESWKLPTDRFSRFGGILHKEGVENFTKVSL